MQIESKIIVAGAFCGATLLFTRLISIKFLGWTGIALLFAEMALLAPVAIICRRHYPHVLAGNYKSDADMLIRSKKMRGIARAMMLIQVSLLRLMFATVGVLVGLAFFGMVVTSRPGL